MDTTFPGHLSKPRENDFKALKKSAISSSTASDRRIKYIEPHEHDLKSPGKQSHVEATPVAQLQAEIETYKKKLAEQRSKSRELELKVKNLEEELHREQKPRQRKQKPRQRKQKPRQRKQKPRQREQKPRQREQKLTPLPEPSRLIRSLRRGQQNFLDAQKQPETATALAFLIQHALTQLALAQSTGKQDRARVMYLNLYTIVRQLQCYRGVELTGFQEALAELERQEPGIEQFGEGLKRSSEPHREEALFQVPRRRLRDHAGIDLVPYFFDIDDDGNVFGFG